MLSIGQMSKRFGLARSTLLYYESIGLLVASARVHANYRGYSEADCRRLEQICLYRKVGLPLRVIGEILGASSTAAATILAQRVRELEAEIGRMRAQQQFIIGILQHGRLLRRRGVMSGAAWVDLLTAAGFSAKDRWEWHREFERSAPTRHRQFLAALGFSRREIDRVRAWSVQPQAPQEPSA